MMNAENFFAYTPAEWDLVSHILTLGVGVHAAALVYFLVTRNQVAEHYRSTSALSAVVMVSAALILLRQSWNWQETFVLNPDSGLFERKPDTTFSNGYRYVNWSIDVPMLLIQMLYVTRATARRFRSAQYAFVVGGLLMIWTGYVGQYFESTNMTQLGIWFAISTAFYLFILWVVYGVISEGRKDAPRGASQMLGVIFALILISWTLYPIAYLIPALWPSSTGMVSRQIIFTMADIVSKVIYGVLIGQVARIRSVAEGYQPAIETVGTEATEHVW